MITSAPMLNFICCFACSKARNLSEQNTIIPLQKDLSRETYHYYFIIVIADF